MEQTNDCFVVSFDKKEKMTFLEFKSKNQIFEKFSHSTVNQIEYVHWDNLKQRTTHCEMPSPMYAIDNEWTLFEDSNNCQWNLGNLSYEDSFIQPVRILWNIIKFDQRITLSNISIFHWFTIICDHLILLYSVIKKQSL